MSALPAPLPADGGLPAAALPLLFGMTAEAVSAFVLPPMVVAEVLNVSALLYNVLGAFLAGAARAVAPRCSGPLRRAVAAFERGFVGGLTSFAYLAEHGAELWATWGLSACTTYCLLNVGAGALACEAGRRLFARAAPPAPAPLAAGHPQLLLRLCAALAALLLALGAWAAATDPYVEDATRPEFATGDGGVRELAAGAALAALGLLVSPLTGGTAGANAVSCALVVAGLLGSGTGLLRAKFVSAFCGCVSSFGGLVADAADGWGRAEALRTVPALIAGHVGMVVVGAWMVLGVR